MDDFFALPEAYPVQVVSDRKSTLMSFPDFPEIANQPIPTLLTGTINDIAAELIRNALAERHRKGLLPPFASDSAKLGGVVFMVATQFEPIVKHLPEDDPE